MKIINDTLIKISGYISTDKYSHVPQVCYGSALQAAKLALDTVTGGQGGKIICSLNSLPTIGNGNLSLKGTMHTLLMLNATMGSIRN